MKRLKNVAIMLILGLLAWLMMSCRPTVQDPPKDDPKNYSDYITYEPFDDLDIDLDTIDGFIDCARFDYLIHIGGNHVGQRLRIANATNHKLEFHSATITSNHVDDALVFIDDVDFTTIDADCGLTLNQALTFWGDMNDVVITGVLSIDAKVGIRASIQKQYSHVYVGNCTIINPELEGMYFGYHKKTDRQSSHIYFMNNLVVSPGWDCYQQGDCISCGMYGNICISPGESMEPGQRHGYTWNPGGIYFYYDNICVDCEKWSECLDSRCFKELPKGGIYEKILQNLDR